MELLYQPGQPGTHEFLIGDTRETFDRNLKMQPLDWPWRNQHITYSLNSQGYRALEWDSCDWNNSILVFGASTVYGVGVKEEHTVCSQLSTLSNSPVINLGGLGVSTAFHWINTVLLHEHNITPKAVVYIWPIDERFLEFDSELRSIPTGVNSLTPLTKSLLESIDTLKNVNDYMRRSCQLLWNCPVYNFTEPGDFQSIPKYITELPYVPHDSREGCHPGPDGYALWAECIYSSFSFSCTRGL